MMNPILNPVRLLWVVLFLAIAIHAQAFDAMRVRIRTDLPKEIKTVGQAAQYFGAAIGYRLTTAAPAPSESWYIAGELIDPLSMTTGIRPVEDAILTLLRDDCLLVVDHEHKLFSFEFKKEAR